MPAEPRINTGIMPIRVRTDPAARDPDCKTLIITGLGRSGTSMVANMLRRGGVFLGQYIHEVVVEDGQMLELIRTRTMSSLRLLIAERNAAHRVWGFKLPNLHFYLRYEELALFRNPHLIVIYRDPVAVAMRQVLSDYYDPMRALTDITGAQEALTQFTRRADCPLLLLSYEKFLITPHPVIDALLGFCGLAATEDAHRSLMQEVQPNRPEYLAVANNRFEGCIDGMFKGRLQGWCRHLDRLDPVELDVLANGILLQSVKADRFREDLANGGMGNGCHGFVMDLVPYQLSSDTIIHVRIRDRALELPNSGQRLGAFPELSLKPGQPDGMAP